MVEAEFLRVRGSFLNLNLNLKRALGAPLASMRAYLFGQADNVRSGARVEALSVLQKRSQNAVRYRKISRPFTNNAMILLKKDRFTKPLLYQLS